MIDEQPTASEFTEQEFREFDRVSRNTGSRDNALRVVARMELRRLIARHGKPKCDAMWKRICASAPGLDAGRVE